MIVVVLKSSPVCIDWILAHSSHSSVVQIFMLYYQSRDVEIFGVLLSCNMVMSIASIITS
jgi:hypothetical protein